MGTNKLEEIILWYESRAGLYPWARSEDNHLVEFLQIISMDDSGDIDIDLPKDSHDLLLMSNQALENLQDRNLVMIDEMEFIIPFRDYKDEALSDKELAALDRLLKKQIEFSRSIILARTAQ